MFYSFWKIVLNKRSLVCVVALERCDEVKFSLSQSFLNFPVNVTALKMLCPEVWNFDPPAFSVSTKFCKTKEEISQALKYQYFNHHVSVVLPNTIQLPNDLINTALEDNQYYRVNQVPAAELLKKEFLDLFARTGRLTAFSLREISEENCLVITPCRKIIIGLSQSIFQKLGIESTLKECVKTKVRKYFVILDLTSDSNEMKKKFEEVYKKFYSNGDIYFDIVLTWEPESPDVCPSSIAYYFSKKNYFVKTCDLHYQHKLRYNVTVPTFDEETEISEFIEWLGAFNLDCDVSSDNCFSSMRSPERSENFGQVMNLTFTGLISHNRLEKIISEIKDYVDAKSPSVWISMTVQGFQDSIVSIKSKQLCLSDGDHHTTIIFRWNEPCLIYSFWDKVKGN